MQRERETEKGIKMKKRSAEKGKKGKRERHTLRKREDGRGKRIGGS